MRQRIFLVVIASQRARLTSALRTGYTTRKAAKAAAANGQPSDLPAQEQADLRVLAGVTTTS